MMGMLSWHKGVLIVMKAGVAERALLKSTGFTTMTLIMTDSSKRVVPSATSIELM
jgi:hypothetical protein